MKQNLSLTLAAAALVATATGLEEVPLPTAAPPPVAIPVPEPVSVADVYQHIGSYRVSSRLKVTDDKVTRVTIKPMVLDVTSNGTTVRVSTRSQDMAASTFDIYRSDGIGRQHDRSGVLEVIPGVQASSFRDGVLRHIRVSREALTITQFAGVSNQTVITHAAAIGSPDLHVAGSESNH